MLLCASQRTTLHSFHSGKRAQAISLCRTRTASRVCATTVTKTWSTWNNRHFTTSCTETNANACAVRKSRFIRFRVYGALTSCNGLGHVLTVAARMQFRFGEVEKNIDRCHQQSPKQNCQNAQQQRATFTDAWLPNTCSCLCWRTRNNEQPNKVSNSFRNKIIR